MGVHLYTAGTPTSATQTTLASQGGLLINIDSATGDIAQTASGWIEDEKFGFNAREFATSTSAEFDSAVTRTGRLTLKLSTLDATGIIRCFPAPQSNYSTAATNLANSHYFIPCKGSTKYRFRCYCKTNNVPSTAVSISVTELNSTGTAGVANGTNTLSGTVDWTLLTTTFTTASTAVQLGLGFFISVAGNVSDAWFDVNSMTLEEVVEPVANSLTSSSPSLVSFTAVGSTDNIDQSQLTINSTLSFSNVAQYQAQQFTPTKSKFTGVILQKTSSIGSPSGTMTFQIVNDSAGNPGTTVLATATYSSAAWASLTNNADFTINLPCNLTAGTAYWLNMSYSTSSGTDYPRINSCAPSAYSGLFKYGTDGITYGTTFNGDAYFKTLYYKPTTNFKASQNNLNVSVSADEEGFIEGSVLNIKTGTWSFTDTVNDGAIQNNMYFERHVGTTFGSNTVQFAGANRYYILKINLGVPASGDLVYTIGFITNNTISYSYDNVTYYTLGTLVAQGGSYNIPMSGYSTVYIKNNANAAGSMTSHSATCPINISSLSTLYNYPTNKDIIKQYSTTLGAATTTATYRATKWGFPAIEYSSVDQSQTVNTGSISFPTVAQYQAQQIITTQTNFAGVTLYKKANVGSPTGDITFSIVNDSAGSPGSTVYATSTMSNATYLALSNNAEFTVSLPCTIPAGTYWIKMSYSVSSATDYPAFGATSPSGYSGLYKYGTDGITYGTTYNGDVYFKTLYSTVQYLDVDTTATGSTVAFSELGTSYTTVADGASLAISSTSTPNLFVKVNITANRLYLSSNDYNASSDKDGSMRQSVVYEVKPNPQITPGNMNSNIKLFYG